MKNRLLLILIFSLLTIGASAKSVNSYTMTTVVVEQRSKAEIKAEKKKAEEEAKAKALAEEKALAEAKAKLLAEEKALAEAKAQAAKEEAARAKAEAEKVRAAEKAETKAKAEEQAKLRAKEEIKESTKIAPAVQTPTPKIKAQTTKTRYNHRAYISYDIPSVESSSNIWEEYWYQSMYNNYRFKDWGISAGYEYSSFFGNSDVFSSFGAKFSYYKGGYRYEHEWLNNSYEEYYIQMYSISVPINIGYNLRIGQKINIALYAGLTSKFNLAGSYDYEYYSDWYDTMSYGLFENSKGNLLNTDSIHSQFQVAWQVGLNLSYQNYSLGVEYCSDLTKLSNYLNYSQLSISVGYKF